ncbi:MAG: 2-aminoethylphosphonate--pyruvate transaminase [Oleiphilaceae bacterium]|nr:2-aminoethylphosphonate--pyruvate transaminase [Oleiphilaceae bacterium]
MTTKMDAPINPYLLLTPGPLSTSTGVRNAMLRDWCTWDDDYKQLVQGVRQRLVRLATSEEYQDEYTAVLMQGSGSASVEATLGSVIPASGHLVILANGAYGQRMATMASILNIPFSLIDYGETSPVDPTKLQQVLKELSGDIYVAMVHCETTTGMLNPIEPISHVCKENNCTFIVDAMSSFGGIPLDLAELNIDFLISSANKCIQGVPGFGFVLAKHSSIAKCEGLARSHSLDLFDQWQAMEKDPGKWRFTSPTHVVRAFEQALIELEQEGGVEARYQRYLKNRDTLIAGMEKLGFTTLLQGDLRSPFISTFLNPQYESYRFNTFYDGLKKRGFVIYPGKVSQADCFRIGTIGHVFPEDIQRLIQAVSEERYWL